MERRLAAILATDVVGYSRLMEAIWHLDAGGWEPSTASKADIRQHFERPQSGRRISAKGNAVPFAGERRQEFPKADAHECLTSALQATPAKRLTSERIATAGP